MGGGDGINGLEAGSEMTGTNLEIHKTARDL
jgi:hypothetical protein